MNIARFCEKTDGTVKWYPLPCPFCGEYPMIRQMGDILEVICKSCNVKMSEQIPDNLDDAFFKLGSRWNKRKNK
jgi:hypothetical protein